jgi:hypothetical protein
MNEQAVEVVASEDDQAIAGCITRFKWPRFGHEAGDSAVSS